jgi:tetratricopeptide (TPR) repeat protein
MVFPRNCVAWMVLLAVLTGGVPVRAQKARWMELTAQVLTLYQEGKYSEALPIAHAALALVEAAYGPDNQFVSLAASNLANVYDGLGRYADSEPLHQRALKIDEKAFGPASSQVAQDLGDLATLYGHKGKYAEAEPLYLRALRIDEKVLKPGDPQVAKDQNNLASLYDDQGKFATAEPLYRRALNIDEKALGLEDVRVAADANNLGLLLQHQGKFGEAEPLLQRAVRIEEKVDGPDHPDVATGLNNLATLYHDEGKFGEVEPLIQRAIAIREKALGQDDAEVATYLNELALFYHDEGKYAEAEPLYQRALSIRTKALGPNDPEIALMLNNLGELYDDEGKYAAAEDLYKRALSDDEKMLGPDHTTVAKGLNNLALFYASQGKYQEAEPLYQRAIKIDEKALGPDNVEVSVDLNNLALLYTDQGKYAESEPLYKRALTIREKAVGPDHPDVASGLNNLAMLYELEGKYGEAAPLDERALSIKEKALGPNHPGVAASLNLLAGNYEDRGNYAAAEPLYKRALAIKERVLWPDHTEVAIGLNNLGALYDHEGKYADAEPLFKRGLSIQEKALGPDHPEVAMSLNNLAVLDDALGKYADAEPLFDRSFDNLFRQFQYNFSYMTEKERLGFLATVGAYFPGYFSFVHRFREKDPQLVGSMYNMLLWEKGFIAGSVADMRRKIEASGDGEALKLLGQLTAKRTQIAALLRAPATDREAWRKQVDQIHAEADEIEKALVGRSAAFAGRRKLERATWQQVRDSLQPGEAAVEFARFHYFDKDWQAARYYVALVITRETKDEPEYIFLGDDRQLEGDAITRFKQSVQTRGVAAEEEAKLPGTDAYDLIWKPLEKSLDGKTRIYLAPDGILNELPLGILPGPDGKLQMEKYDLRLVTSTRDILRSAPSRAAETALLVGNPVFDLSEEQQVAALQKLALPHEEVRVSALAGSDVSKEVSRDQDKIAALPRLPGTGAEVNAIAELMKAHQWKASVYTNELALKRVVEGVSSPRVVHLATHGFFLPDQRDRSDRAGSLHSGGEANPATGLEDPMLRSGLFFAGADRTLAGKPTAEGLDNGVLTAMEAGNLNLSGTELVVLSACDTGRGEVKNGEGVFGLRRALEEAGAAEVLMSLWPVPDAETLELMKRFYAKWLGGMEIHQALKESQLEMREAVKAYHDGKDLPVYWGAFVLVGK